MTTAPLSASVSVISSASSTSASTGKLVELANGEYTADSVSSDQTDATKLGLIKEKDGNYGTSKPADTKPSASAAAQSSSNVQWALTSLTLGGS